MSQKQTGFTTTRMTVRDWTECLADATCRTSLTRDLATILTPPVLQHLPPPLWLGGPDAIPAWIDARAAEATVLTLRHRETDALLGLLILATRPDATHLGYLLAETAWGQGLATELLLGLVAWRRTLGPSTLRGGVAPDNPASARVLEKAGFTRDATLSSPDVTMFSLTVL